MIRNHNKPCRTYSSQRPVGDGSASFCDLYSTLGSAACPHDPDCNCFAAICFLARTLTTCGLLLAGWDSEVRLDLYSNKLFRQHKYGK